MKYLILTAALFATMGQALAHVDLDSPVGGENYSAGEIVTIKWHIRIAHPQDNWDLYFSTDSGVTWQVLGLDLPVSQLSFTWTVPDVSTPNAKIKIVMDNQGPDYESISNDFAIGVFVPLMLNYPMGNEILAAGHSTEITWQVNGLVTFDSWNLYFSDNGGTSWLPLAESLTPATLSYSWMVPLMLTDKARIKLEMNIGGTIYEDISGVFTISDQVITGLEDGADARQVWLYPNPAANTTMLSGLGEGKISITLLSPQGKLIRQVTKYPVAGKVEIDLSALRAGIYLLNSTQSENQFINRLVVH